MSLSFVGRPSRALSSLRLALVLVGLAAPAAAQLAPYAVLDRVEGPNVQFNSAPIRPMVLVPGTDTLWAVNHHDSTVERFVGPFTSNVTSDEARRVPWGPVSIAWWDGDVPINRDDVPPQLLVVCRNSWAMLRMDEATGMFRDVVQLPAEPSDILVDQVRDVAYVSCMGADAVVVVDLRTDELTPSRTLDAVSEPAFDVKSPLYLSFNPFSPATAREVFITPLHSGNNSTPRGPATDVDATGSVINLDVAQGSLPDEDVFRFDPAAAQGSAIEAVGTGMGTLLFAHAMDATGTVWLLNTEGNNKNPALQSEPAVKGQVVFNRISRFTNAPQLPVLPTDIISLDTPGSPVGQPIGIAGPSTAGEMFVCGMLTDNVQLIRNTGVLGNQWPLPEGSIPRAIMMLDGTHTLTYCWGTNEILVHDTEDDDPDLTAVTLSLRRDPTPEHIRHGRELFYDGSKSEQGNASCASCHFDAGVDFLAWNLSNLPKDDKGPLVTQTLVGLDRLEPFHWRGERLLEDFNGAFVGLLGADDVLTDDEFADLKAFLFALKNPANPNQHRERLLDPTEGFASVFKDGAPGPGQVGTGNAVDGQDDWLNENTFGFIGNDARCDSCHQLPTGTNNDVFPDSPGVTPAERTHFKNTPFNEIWRKQQPLFDPGLAGNQGIRALLGVGTSHTGLTGDLFQFTEAGNVIDAEDAVAFVHQWDQGVGKAVHYAYQVDAATDTMEAMDELTTYLQGQIDARNCDVVVFGRSIPPPPGGPPTPVRWRWDRFATTPGFVSDDPELFDEVRSFTDFIDGALLGENNVFVGLPVGTAERFGTDFDLDGLANQDDDELDEFTPAAPSVTDLDPPVFVTTPHSPWQTTRVARLSFDTDELTTAVVEYTDRVTLETLTVTSDMPSRTHAVMLTGLRASSNFTTETTEFDPEPLVEYDVKVTVTDLSAAANETVSDQAALFSTKNFTTPDEGFFDPGDTILQAEADRFLMEAHFVRELKLTLSNLFVFPDGAVTGTANVTVAFKRGALVDEGGVLIKKPAPRRLVVARIMHQDSGSDDVTVLTGVTPNGGTLQVDSLAVSDGIDTEDVGVNGPFLINELLTGTDGKATIKFRAPVGSVTPGDRLYFNIEAILEVPEDLTDVEYPAALAALNCPTACDLVVPVVSPLAYAQWDFPTTKEARACVSKKFQPGAPGGDLPFGQHP